MKYPINDEGIELLKTSEDFVGVAYPDPVSPMGRALQKAGLWRQTLNGVPIPEKFQKLDAHPWTIGWGFTDGVGQGDEISRPAADAKLSRMLLQYRSDVLRMCTVRPNENQLAALVVCGWNIGLPRLRTSSMIKAHNRGDIAAASRAFSLWNKAGGKVVNALVTRRAAESALYLKAPPGHDMPADDEIAALPQTVQAETNLLRSPIIQGTAATATTGITALANIADQATTVTTAWGVLEPLVKYWPYIAMAAIVVVAGAVIWHRYQQRKQGWA
jgi:lysozyme